MSGLLKASLFLSVFAVTLLTILRLTKELRLKSAAEPQLQDLEKNLTDLKIAMSDSSEYLRSSKFVLLKEELFQLKKQAQELRSLLLRRRRKALLLEIKNFEKGFSDFRESVNERFFQQEKIRAKSIFTDEQGNDLLTEEQLRAVLCDDDRNLIIAGAGSGKTRVIDFKVRYLVNYKNVSPHRILILSFSKKSASDLVKKISESVPGIEARTIHSFASQIIGRQSRKLFDDGRKELEGFIIEALVLAFNDPGIFQLFQNFYEKFFSILRPFIFYKDLDELRRDLKKLNSALIDTPDRFGEIQAKRSLKTLRGELVRSIDERYIADFLYLQNINYEYEQRYPHADSYFPDFYLTDYDIYFEHFAITASGGPPPYFENPQKYMNGIQWKKNIHQEKNTRLIESYSYLLNEKGTSLYLADLLAENGVDVLTDLENDEVYSKISREFCRIFTRFYQTFKLSGLSLSMLKTKTQEKKYFTFLPIFESFLNHFERLVTSENKMDFNEMIIGAISKYRTDKARSFDYIIVDEFQDTSNLAMKLLEEVYQGNPGATFSCVGDDWQSIYGFNGSDVTLLSDYPKRHPDVSVRYLNANFRSHSNIVELGKRFISKNPYQVPKNVISKNNYFKTSQLGFLSVEQMDEQIRALPDDESVLILYRYNDDCPVSMGFFRDLFELDRGGKPVRKASCNQNISMMTIHASKGLEAQHVFVLFPESLRRKFPSEIEDHFIFNMLKTSLDDFPFSEERRLMYVAMTRAEQNLYFVSPHKEPSSVFWDELKELARQKNA